MSDHCPEEIVKYFFALLILIGIVAGLVWAIIHSIWMFLTIAGVLCVLYFAHCCCNMCD